MKKGLECLIRGLELHARGNGGCGKFVSREKQVSEGFRKITLATGADDT